MESLFDMIAWRFMLGSFLKRFLSLFIYAVLLLQLLLNILYSFLLLLFQMNLTAYPSTFLHE
jgi:hypothetical protein